MTLDRCIVGDCRTGMRELIAGGVKAQTVVTSPPYWGLRDYGIDGQLGLERSPIRYLARMRSVFRLVWEVLADDGTLWLNMGDSYYSPRTGGGIGSNSKINGKESMQAARDARRAMNSNKQLTSTGSIVSGANRRQGLTGLKSKDLVGMPWLLALVLRADGWYLRSDIIWHKNNPMPESCGDRPTKSHEYLFLLSKSERYYYDAEAIREAASQNTHARMGRAFAGYAPPGQPAHGGVMGSRENSKGVNPKARVPSGWDSGDGDHRGKVGRYPRAKQNESMSAAISGKVVEWRNKRSVWTVNTEGFPGAHFATFPEKLIEPCILAGSRSGDIVFDPFMGAGTVAAVATRLGRRWLGCELNPAYAEMQKPRAAQTGMPI